MCILICNTPHTNIIVNVILRIPFKTYMTMCHYKI